MFRTSSVSADRRRRGYVLAACAVPALTVALIPLRETLALATTMPAFLLLTVVVAAGEARRSCLPWRARL